MLEDLIAKHRAAILQGWFERVTASYPDQTTSFLRNQRDPFANPVGANLHRDMETIVDGLAAGREMHELMPALDGILRVRVLQEMSPAQAVGFILQLRSVIRDCLDSEGDQAGGAAAAAAVEERLEQLLLAAFNVYVACLEQVYRIRVNEIRNRSMKTMERLNEWRAKRDGAPGLDAVD